MTNYTTILLYRSFFDKWIHYGAVVILFLPLPVYLISLYFVWTKGKNTLPLEFKILYTSTLIVAITFHVLSFSIHPVIVPPYHVAFTTIGWAAFIFEPEFQLSLIYAIGSLVYSLHLCVMYFRMDAMLPRVHFLKKNSIRLGFYCLLLFAIFNYFPASYLFVTVDAKIGRDAMTQEYGSIPPFSLYDHFVIFYVATTSPYCFITLGYIIASVFVPAIVFLYIIGYTLKVYLMMKQHVSKKTAEIHKMLIIALIVQFGVQSLMMVIPDAFVFGLLQIGYRNHEIYVIFTWIVLGNSAGGATAMLLVNRSYRQALLSILLMRVREVRRGIHFIEQRSPTKERKTFDMNIGKPPQKRQAAPIVF